MKLGKVYNPQNTLVLLSLARFEEVTMVDDSVVSFRFNGETYEAARMEGWLCVGSLRDHFFTDEFWAVIKAGEDLMRDNPYLQCFYSAYDDYFRIRLWLECQNILDFEKALFKGIYELGQINADLQIRIQHHLFMMVAPTFEALLKIH